MDECLTQEDVSAEADVNENHVTEIDLEGNIINFLLKLREKYNVSQKAAVFVTVCNYVVEEFLELVNLVVEELVLDSKLGNKIKSVITHCKNNCLSLQRIPHIYIYIR